MKKLPFFQGIEKKEKSPKQSLPTAWISRVISFGIWVFLLILLGSSVLFLVRFGSITQTNEVLTKKLSALEKKTEQLQLTNQQSDNLDVFGRYFIQSYYMTDVKQDVYQKTLEPYFSKGIEVPNVGDGKRKKQIKSIQLWAKEWDGTTYHCTYLVHYSVDDGSRSELIHFQVGEEDGAYGVVSYPYIEQVSEFKTTAIPKIAQQKPDKVDPANEETQKAIKQWLNETFFPRYMESTNLDDVSYMMTTPVLLGNLQLYDGIDQLQAYPVKSEWDVYVTIRVIDRVTNARSKQEYSLRLAKKEDKYVVEALSHTLGGTMNDEEPTNEPNTK